MKKKELSERQLQICKNLKHIRNELGLNQDRYSELLDISIRTYCYYECGERMMPAITAAKIVDVAKKIGIKIHIGDLTFNKIKAKHYRTYE